MKGTMKPFIKVMNSLSDPNRIKIIKLLQQKQMCACELQEALGISQPSVSKHPKILEEAGMADYLKDGLWVKYYLEKANNNPYVVAMMRNLERWLDDDPQTAELTEKVPFMDRKAICNK